MHPVYALRRGIGKQARSVPANGAYGRAFSFASLCDLNFTPTASPMASLWDFSNRFERALRGRLTPKGDRQAFCGKNRIGCGARLPLRRFSSAGIGRLSGHPFPRAEALCCRSNAQRKIGASLPSRRADLKRFQHGKSRPMRPFTGERSLTCQSILRLRKDESRRAAHVGNKAPTPFGNPKNGCFTTKMQVSFPFLRGKTAVSTKNDQPKSNLSSPKSEQQKNVYANQNGKEALFGRMVFPREKTGQSIGRAE